MQELPIETKVEMTLPFLIEAKSVPQDVLINVPDRLRKVLLAAGDRIKVAGDILDYDTFFLSPLPGEHLQYDEAVFDKYIRHDPDAPARLKRFRARLATVEPFDPTSLEKLLQQFVADEQVGVGRIIHAVRVAVTGKSVGFGLFETLAILGREEVLARIDQTLAR